MRIKPTAELCDGLLRRTTWPENFVVRAPGDAARSVYNLRLGAASDAETDHLLSAGGLVTGDFFLQDSLQPRLTSRQ
jgi:hypothetical protein